MISISSGVHVCSVLCAYVTVSTATITSNSMVHDVFNQLYAGLKQMSRQPTQNNGI